MADLFFSESQRGGERPVLLVSDEATCRRTITALAGGAGWSPVAGMPAVSDFPLASERFLDAFCHRVAVALIEGLTARLAARSDVGPPGLLHDRVIGQILADADRMIPAAWQTHLRSAIERIRTGTERPGETASGTARARSRLVHCLSCSAFLTDGVHGGVSDSYCRYCSDESGTLKPREEVENLLARWIARWQGGLSPEESRQKAAQFMKAMPAWSGN